jgi:hypothetical protein
VPIFRHLNFAQDKITNFEAYGAYVVCMIVSHRMLMLCQLDDYGLALFFQPIQIIDSGVIGPFFRKFCTLRDLCSISIGSVASDP